MKVCLVGPTNSGKTYYATTGLGVERTHDFEVGKGTTLGVNLDLISYRGHEIDVWDTGSIHVGLGAAYTKNSDGIIWFHDREDNPLPFDLLHDPSVPVVHVWPGGDRPDPMSLLLRKLQNTNIKSRL